MGINLSKREIRCLRRIAERKSIPDFAAYGYLCDKNMLTQEGTSDDLLIRLTDLGREACRKYGIEDRRTPAIEEARKT